MDAVDLHRCPALDLCTPLCPVLECLCHAGPRPGALKAAKPPVSTVVLFAFSKITEPDPLPWFSRTSGGRACVFCWTLFCLVMILAYQSNLRAHMTTVRYGKPLNTLEDIVEHGKRVWIVTSILTQT